MYALQQDEHICCNCEYWDMDFQTFAKVNGGTFKVCQCVASAMADDNAPFADAGGPLIPIFTQENNTCDAFCAAEEVLSEIQDLNATYRDLDYQLRRDGRL